MELESFPWMKLLLSTQVKDILKKNAKIVSANFFDDVAFLLQKLSSANVSAAIITDSERPGIYGFVDVLDLMACILEVASESKDITRERVENLKWQGKCLTWKQSGTLINLSQSNPLETVCPQSSLLEVVEIFAKEIHRVAVVEDRKVVGVLSQIDIVRFLARRGSWLGTKMEKSIGEIGLLPALGVFSVLEDLNVLEAIRKMIEMKVSGLAVINSNGCIVSDLSGTDFLGLNQENFALLQLSVGAYLQRIHGFSKPPVCCRLQATVEDVILKLSVHRVHRIYVVNDSRKPVGIVTLTDIMQFLLAEHKLSYPQQQSS